MGYSIILPTLNEVGHIVKLIEEIKFNFLEIKEEFEIILVDDNSTDGTIDLLENVAKDHENIHFFLRKGLKKNLADSINLGIQKSKYENIIWMDSDFQHPPDYIKLFHDYQNKYDLVIFSRFLKIALDILKMKNLKRKAMKTKVFFLINYAIFFFTEI